MGYLYLLPIESSSYGCPSAWLNTVVRCLALDSGADPHGKEKALWGAAPGAKSDIYDYDCHRLRMRILLILKFRKIHEFLRVLKVLVSFKNTGQLRMPWST